VSGAGAPESGGRSPSATGEPCRTLIVCHEGHENDVCCTENIVEYLSALGIDCGHINLRGAHATDELHGCLARGPAVALLGFNAQLDHVWLAAEALLDVAARHGVTVTQWIFDHPSARWPEFNRSNARNSRFVFHSPYSQAYFQRYCCPGAATTTAGSIGPHRRSRSAAETFAAFSCRPVRCLIALSLSRLDRTAVQTEEEIESLERSLQCALKEATTRARFDLDQPLERHLATALADGELALDDPDFSRCFRLLNDSVQYLRRAEIMRVAQAFDVTIQSDETARALVEGGRARFRAGVSSVTTLDNMPRCRTALSVSPVNDSVHDRACNALNAGCLPILEDNRAHRGLFAHGENALLFRYGDGSLAECLALACASPDRLYPMADRAAAMRDLPPFRFGAFRNIVALAGLEDAADPV
jgi:hypothetical protein